MKTELLSELELFHRFVSNALRNGRKKQSPEDALAAFRTYHSELSRLRRDIKPSLERSLRGESQPLNLKRLKNEVTKRLAKTI